MQFPGKAIAVELENHLQPQVHTLTSQGRTPHLTTILLGDSDEQISYVSSKKKVAEKLGIEFEFIHIHHIPSFELFMQFLKKHSSSPHNTGIIIQHPLPVQLQTDSIYNYIHILKEIEGHNLKSPFHPPISLAVLTVLKNIYSDSRVGPHSIFNIKKDVQEIKKALKGKKIVIAGRGKTGGEPIGKTFNFLKINYMSINSQTHDPQQYYKTADIIITAVGKKIITRDVIEPGVVLINAGLRRENGALVGDYDEEEIKDIASYYTTTPGGIGPIDVLYLYKNLIDATSMQMGVRS